MFGSFRHLERLGTHVVQASEYLSSLKYKLFKTVDCTFCAGNRLNFHNSSSVNDFTREKISPKDAWKEKEAKDLDVPLVKGNRFDDMLPTYDIMEREFYGMVFKNIPILYIQATRNNTKLSLTSDGVTKVCDSAGMQGFKNTRKGTNLAAQSTAVAFSQKLMKHGFKTVRVMVQGLGAGRTGAIKGLQLGGINVVSITDYTITSKNERPRKQRRL